MFELTLVRHGQSNGNAAKISMGYSPGFLTEKGKDQARILSYSLREVFLSTNFDAIYCSDLTRVVETCEIALQISNYRNRIRASSTLLYDSLRIGDDEDEENEVKEFEDIDVLYGEPPLVLFSPLLREKSAGIYELQPKSMQAAAYKDSKSPRTFRPKGGESWDDVQARVVEFIEKIKHECAFPVTDVVQRKIVKARYHCCTSSAFEDVVVSDKIKKILVFTSGGVIKEFINAYVLKSNEYPNQVHNCGMFVFRCNPSFTKVRTIVENKPPDDAGECSWEQFMEDNEPELPRPLNVAVAEAGIWDEMEAIS